MAWGESEITGTKLESAELNSLIPGARVKGKMAVGGSKFSIFYDPSGRLQGKSGGRSDAGKWELEDDLICFQWNNWREGKRHCVNLYHQEGNRYCSFYPDGTPSACGKYERES